jgi:general secretion pathway protein G
MNRMHIAHRPRSRRAFTLIELLIVIAILLAIGGLVVVNLLPKREQADVDLTKLQIRSFESAIEQFQLDMKRVPTEDEGLAVLWNKDMLEDEDEAAGWRGPYLKDPVPTDTWGTAWVYRYPGEIRDEEHFDIVSAGPDREEDTEDDINNHYAALDEDGELREDFDLGDTAGG